MSRSKKGSSTYSKRFQRIIDAVVSSYTKLQDEFVDRYSTKERESVAQAKERIKREQQERANIHR